MTVRTTIILPQKLVAEAKRATGAKSKTEAVIRSLELAVQRKKAEGLIALFGKLPLHVDIDKSREREIMVLVDTNIWIDVFKNPNSPHIPILKSLIPEKLIRITGIVEAELLSGARTEAEYTLLEDRLISAPVLDDCPGLWGKTAKARFQLARKGHQVSLTDIAIAVMAHHYNLRLWTRDRPFEVIQKGVPFKFFAPNFL